MTALETGKAIREGKLTAVEATKQVLDSAEANNGKINAYITICREKALAQAEEVQKKINSGELDSPLAGVPIAIKDNICTKGIKTTCASRILGDFTPVYNATVMERLDNAGLVTVGKLNMDEFAMGSTSETSYYGAVHNPWDLNKVTGGSSGGSASSVAGKMSLITLGSDTGGSIRQPASYCGVTGFKPTYGTVSRFGLIAYASSLDQAGPMTKTVEDAAIMLEKMAGFDEFDSTSADIAVPDFKAALKSGVKGLKIGMPKEFLNNDLNTEIASAWQEGKAVLEKAGAEVKEISLPNMKYALATYYIIAPAEASSNLARYDGVRFGLRVEGSSLDEMYENTRSAGFGAEVQRRIMIGTYVLSAGYYDAYYLKALNVRKLIRQDYINAFKEVDAILTPVAPTTAFTIEESKKFDPVTNYLQDAFTVPVNLAKLPAISVPVKTAANGLPIGLQLIGKDFDEETLFRSAYVLEQNNSWSRK